MTTSTIKLHQNLKYESKETVEETQWLNNGFVLYDLLESKADQLQKLSAVVSQSENL
jgi:hypothetical protein